MGQERLNLALKELDIALENRIFEIQSFWQRSNYFLVLLTALGAATFVIDDFVIQFIMSGLSAACSYLWYRTNLGSKFWQESWEVEVTNLSKEIGIASFERRMPDVIKQVRESLSGSGLERSRFKRFINNQVSSKPSVTTNMIFLSMIVTAVWMLITTIFAWRLFDKHCEYSPSYIFCAL